MLKFLRRKNSDSVHSKNVRRRKSLDFETTRGTLSPSLVLFERKETGENAKDVKSSGSDTERRTEASGEVVEASDAAVKKMSSAPPSPVSDEQVVLTSASC